MNFFPEILVSMCVINFEQAFIFQNDLQLAHTLGQQIWKRKIYKMDSFFTCSMIYWTK